MKAGSFKPEDIRNIVLLGHGGAGKTMLAEAVLHKSGAVSRLGSINDGTTTADFEPEAKEHKHSTNSTLLYATYQGKEINVVDTPGHPEFVGSALAALPAAETALIVVNAATGIEFNTRRLFDAAGELGLARMLVINKLDLADGKLSQLVGQLQEAFGPKLHCVNLPAKGGKDVIDCLSQESGSSDILSVGQAHKELLEAIVEADDAQLEKYLAGEKLELPELKRTFIKAVSKGLVVPVVFTAATSEVGLDALLWLLVEAAPSPMTGRTRKFKRASGEPVEITCDASQPFLAHVFKVSWDQHLGQLAMLRILQGKLDADTSFVTGTDKRPRRVGQVLKLEGREHPEFEGAAYAGELVALARVEDIHVDQLLHTPGENEDLTVIRPQYPAPMMSQAVQAKSRTDEVKVSQALQKLNEEDPTFDFHTDPTTHEMVMSGLGELHLRVMLERLRHRNHLEVATRAPTVPYRETITQKADGHYRHKKQTGGAGQFGEVYLRIEPLPRGEGVQFASEVFGGSIPTHFMQAVEKGVHDALGSGDLAGFPVHDVRVIATDGKSHPVDSKDIAFRTAAKYAVRDAFSKAKPVLLEPMVNMEISAPEQYMGSITGDLKHVRGRVMGMDASPGGLSVVKAQAPLAELGSYAGQLRGLTGGQGSFVMEFSHYEPVPPAVHQKIVEARAAHRRKDED